MKNSEEAPLLADNDSMEDAGAYQSSLRKDGDLKQSSLERLWIWLRNHLLMVAISILLIGGLVTLSIYFAYLHHPQAQKRNPPAICLTPSCVLAASGILENLSPNRQAIDPCVDFNKFACEGFVEKHDFRADQSSIFTGTFMAERSQRILRHLLEAPYEADHEMATSTAADRDNFDKLRDLYEACMDEDRLKRTGSAPLLKILRRVESLYPMNRSRAAAQENSVNQLLTQQPLASANESSNHLSKTVTYLASIGVASLIEINVRADDKDPDFVVPFVNAPRQPGLPSKEYYQDTQIVKSYGQVIGQVLEALLQEASFNSNEQLIVTEILAQSAELVEEVLEFETRLANATPATEEAEDVTFYYNPLTLDDIVNLVPQLSLKYFVSALVPAAPLPKKLIVQSPRYFQDLSGILYETKPETLQAFFVWKIVQSYAYKIEDDAVIPLKRFNNALQGKDPDATEERWRTCVKVAHDGLGWILSKFFVEKAFSESAKNFGDNVISDIRIQFIEKLKRANWMSQGVRELGIQKVHAIVQKIGYPVKSPDILNDTALKVYYESVNITNTTYFSNALSIAEFDVRKLWSALGKPTNRDKWSMNADTVNAYYNPPGNEIVFPAGIMQKPVFYDPSIPQYLTYGAFGAISGHELSHAFDSSGRHYDESGNYTDWWDDATVKAFEEKVKCFIDQYEEFTVPNPNGNPLHVNGRLTLGENIADAGGLNAAFGAWKAVEAQHQSQLLPGLQDFSKEQMFFISYANWWCGKSRPEAAVSAIYRDPHAPMWARILGAVANSQHFRESFNCPVKQPTCELW